MRLITRLETPAEVTNHVETCGHLTPCNGIFLWDSHQTKN